MMCLYSSAEAIPRGCRDQYTGPGVGREGRPQAAKFFLVHTYFTLNYSYFRDVFVHYIPHNDLGIFSDACKCPNRPHRGDVRSRPSFVTKREHHVAYITHGFDERILRAPAQRRRENILCCALNK